MFIGFMSTLVAALALAFLFQRIYADFKQQKRRKARNAFIYQMYDFAKKINALLAKYETDELINSWGEAQLSDLQDAYQATTTLKNAYDALTKRYLDAMQKEAAKAGFTLALIGQQQKSGGNPQQQQNNKGGNQQPAISI